MNLYERAARRTLLRRFGGLGSHPECATHRDDGSTNAAIESINSEIQWGKFTTRGFRNKRNIQTAIYLHCGGPDMAPSYH
jgi:hypothetical protein